MSAKRESRRPSRRPRSIVTRRIKRAGTTRDPQRASTDPDAPAAPEGRLPVVLDELDAQLDAGNVDGARQAGLGHPQLRSWLGALAIQNIARMRAAAVLAEIYFAYGEDTDARTLIAPYAVSQQSFLQSTLAPRHKLQLAEYFYSLFQPQLARSVAQEILESATDPCDIAECCYYLSRFCLRQLKMQNLSNHFCLRGLEALQSVALSEARSQKTTSDARLRWLTGKILRVRGNALRWLGRVSEAVPVLYLSAATLAAVKGCGTQQGDAFHALGRLLRSRSTLPVGVLDPGENAAPPQYSEALGALEAAVDLFKGHDLKLSRAHVDLARTHLDKALERREAGDRAGSDASFEEAEKNLARALALSTTTDGQVKPDTLWVRQHIDVLIWRSWYWQEVNEVPTAKDVEEAKRAAKAALDLIEPKPADRGRRVTDVKREAGAVHTESLYGRAEHVETELALGHCALLSGDLTDAGLHIKKAEDLAGKLAAPKLMFHAALSRAERDLNRSVEAAQVALNDAADLKVADRDFGRFLLAKEKRLKKKLSESSQDFFTCTKEDLLEKFDVPPGWNRLKVFMCRAERWAVETAVRAAGDSVVKASQEDYLDVAPGTIRDIRRRYADLEAKKPWLKKEKKKESDAKGTHKTARKALQANS